MIKEIITTKYETPDGAVFYDKATAEAHVVALNKQKEIAKTNLLEGIDKLLILLESVPSAQVAMLGMNGYGRREPRVVNEASISGYKSTLEYEEDGFNFNVPEEEREKRQNELLAQNAIVHELIKGNDIDLSKFQSFENHQYSGLKSLLVMIRDGIESDYPHRIDDILSQYYNSTC